MYQPGGSFGKFAVNIDRKSVVEGKKVDLGGWRIIKKKKGGLQGGRSIYNKNIHHEPTVRANPTHSNNSTRPPLSSSRTMCQERSYEHSSLGIKHIVSI